MNSISMEDSLPPRRFEILNTIKEYTLITADQIDRNFVIVNKRTIRYHIKKLIDEGFIRKRGVTKGVYYEMKE